MNEDVIVMIVGFLSIPIVACIGESLVVIYKRKIFKEMEKGESNAKQKKSCK